MGSLFEARVYSDVSGWRVGVSVWVIMFFVEALESALFGHNFALLRTAAECVLGIVLGATFWPLSVGLGRITRLPIGTGSLASSAIATGVHVAIVQSAHTITGLQLLDEWPVIWPTQLLFLTYYVGYSFYGFILARRNMEDAHARAMESARLTEQAKLEALRYQVAPHFLFNALNACATLISENRAAEAKSLLIKLSHFYRGRIIHGASETVPLAEEFEAQENYLEIERIRFGDRISISVTLPDDLRTFPVPRLILQPLLENAVKHGVAQTRELCAIELEARRRLNGVELRVANDAPRDPAGDTIGAGVGLDNVRHRISAFYNEQGEVRISKGKRFEVLVCIPGGLNG